MTKAHIGRLHWFWQSGQETERGFKKQVGNFVVSAIHWTLPRLSKSQRGRIMPAESFQADSVGIDAHGVAALLGISESHFFALLRSGRFGPQARRLGRARRYDREEVLTWFRAGCPARSRWQAMRGGGQ